MPNMNKKDAALIHAAYEWLRENPGDWKMTPTGIVGITGKPIPDFVTEFGKSLVSRKED